MRDARFRILVCAGLMLLAGGAFLAGCRSTGSTAAPATTPPTGAVDAARQPDISGTYALVSINGSALPYTMTHEAPGVRVTSGSFKIAPDGTCSSEMSFIVPSGEAMNRSVSATWTRDGAKLTMSWQGAGTTIGTVDGDMFTMDNEGQLLAYRKTP